MTDAAPAEGGLEPRTVARVRGRVVAVQVEALDAPARVTARIQDHWGRLDAVFMGRRSIPGVEPGAVLEVEGRVCEAESGPVVYNPRYVLVSAP